MDKLIIEGGRPLSGEVTISGAKNATLPILAATLLTDQPSVLHNVPNVRDVSTMLMILRTLGMDCEHDDNSVSIRPSGELATCRAPYDLVSTMRASICVLGALAAKQGAAEVSLPGGCVIGPRPIDLHLKGLRALGADIDIRGGYVCLKAKQLRGARIYLGGPFGSSVLATANVMMAATLAKGTTRIDNAACEPEVVDLAECLNRMGAKIYGARSHTIEIEGVSSLAGIDHTVISDRIEAGTYMVAGAMSAGDIRIRGARLEDLAAVVDKLHEAGAVVDEEADGVIRVRGADRVNPTDVTALPFPGFPTDLQAQMMALMTQADGISVITERVYPERFMHIAELNRMGASIKLEGASGIVHGPKALSGAPVMACDLRASAALVLAGLVGDGRTEISRVYHLDRGYDGLEQKLAGLGANIWREADRGATEPTPALSVGH